MDASSTPTTSRAFVYLGSELAGTVTDGSEARYYINDHLGTTELVTDANGTVLNTIRHTPFGDEVESRSLLEKLDYAIDDVEIIDRANTTAVITSGQAVPAKTVQTVEQLLYSSDESSSVSDPHFVTVKQYTYDYTDTDVLQLKVISKISYEGSTESVEKIEYIDLTDKALGQYQISLDLRKDVGADTPTENQKFSVYVSKIKTYVGSQIQTNEIPVTSGANTFVLSQEGTGLDNIAWSYSADGGSIWTEFTAGNDTSLEGATSIILRAILTPGDELPILTSFMVTFISVDSESEDFTFTGKEKDVTGLYYFGARYYDPEVGEFISEDPGQDGTDWYRYCRSNPINYVDYDGKEVVQITLPGVGKTYFEKKLVERLLHFMNRVENELGIKVKFNSVYRTVEYQTHLYEIYYFKKNHGGARSEENIAEMNAHGLWHTNIVASPSVAPHSMASAFDLDVDSIINGTWSGALIFARVIQIAQEYGFQWQGWGDKFHFGFYDYESLGYKSRADMIEQNFKSYLSGGTSWNSINELKLINGGVFL